MLTSATTPEQPHGGLEASRCLAGGEEGAAVDAMIFPG